MQANSPPTRRLIFVFHIVGSSSQLLLFTYSCDTLIRESTNIGTAVYSGPWTHLTMDKIGKLLRKDLTMIILRSSKPCCLTASGFFPVSLETCTKVLIIIILTMHSVIIYSFIHFVPFHGAVFLKLPKGKEYRKKRYVILWNIQTYSYKKSQFLYEIWKYNK